MKYVASLFFLFCFSVCAVAQKWQPLTNNNDLSGWKALAGKASFTIANGEITGAAVFGSPNTFLVTDEMYSDFILELDLRVDDLSSNSGIMVRGQYDPNGKNGNGLVYGYQVEADPTARAWSGGIYDEARRGWLYPLDLNPAAKKAFKLGEWNHYRIECIGNTIKTWVNNIPVAYVADDIDASGFIGLQVHSIGKAEDEGKQSKFKNLKIQTEDLKPMEFNQAIYAVNNLTNALTRYERKNNYRLLFNGSNTSGWKGAYKPAFPEKGWRVADGQLIVEPSSGGESVNGGDIVSLEKFSAFDLSFDFKLTPGANSGIKYFVTLTENNSGSAIGLEYQLLDDEKHPDAKMGKDGNRTLASLYDLIKADKQPRFVKPPGEWNKGRVVVYPNNKVEHYLNGVLVLSYVRGSDNYRELVAGSKYKDWKNFGEAKEGHLLLQDHGNEVFFKNIRVRELK